MNRLAPWPDAFVADPPESAGSQLSVSRSASTHPSSHALFVPLHYERRYPYPLVIWLHGSGENERVLQRVMPQVSLRNFVGIAPRGTGTADEDTGRGGYYWSQKADHILLAEQRVSDALSMARNRLNIADDRIFLAGFADGGTMALRIGLNQPRRFAGVLSFGGALPTGQCPLRRLHDARRLPLLMAAGRDSTRYPESLVSRDLRLLHVAGMCLTLRQYPSGDDVTPHMLSDMNRWLMEQVCPSNVD